MKLNSKQKYFLRGLGIGIIAAVLLCILFPTKMSDSQIRSAARDLGMVDKEENIATSNKEQKLESILKSDEDAPKVSDKPDGTSKPTAKPTTKPTTKPSVKPTKEPKKDSDSIVIEIKGGMSSESIANKLYELEIIKDKAKFDKYLTSSGYADKLRAGKHTIKYGMEYEDIAEAITSPAEK